MMIRKSAACNYIRTSLSVFRLNQTCFVIIAGDETWIFEYDLETKCQSCQWKSLTSLRPKKARRSKSKVKVMQLVTFFAAKSIVYSEFLPQGQMINQQVYKEILQLLLRLVREKRQELW